MKKESDNKCLIYEKVQLKIIHNCKLTLNAESYDLRKHAACNSKKQLNTKMK
jgi:hypothetical protein